MIKSINISWAKISIFVFWTSLIFIFLYSPFFKHTFFEKKTITILTWADMIDLQTVARFEAESGIKVNVNYYENNEELFAKLQVTQGQEYDLITITDNGVDYLRRNELIKKIDKSKLLFWNDIEPRLINHYFDPNNYYSIPYNWDIYGLGINRNYFGQTLPAASWNLIFDEKFAPNKISMIDDAYDSVLIAAKYLYGSIDNLSKEKLEEIKDLLIMQKKWVEVYTDLRSDYFLKLGICPVVVAQSAYIYRAIEEDHGHFAFLIPKEGSFLIIDSIVIPVSSQKDDLVYTFINFLFKKNEIINFVKKFGYLPVTKEILYSLNFDYIGDISRILSSDNFKKFSFFKREIPFTEISKLWIEVKSA